MATISTATTLIESAKYVTEVRTGNHHFIADEPRETGGQDAGPAPYDLLLAALGSCTTITLKMYADKKGWDLGELQVDLELRKTRDGTTSIHRTLKSSSNLSTEQWSRLLAVAEKTPVTLTIKQGAAVHTQRDNHE